MEEQKNTQPWIAVCTPSRGLIFAEHEEYIENVRDSYPHIRAFRTHDLPIPDCFNSLANQVLLDTKYEYLWWIEDDTIPPVKALDHLLEAMKDADIAAIDYGFNGNHNTIGRSSITKEILFTGFGCTLMKRSVLEAFTKPIFRADRAFNLSNMSWYPVDPAKVYGMYDLVFASEARKKGFRITQVEGECKHLELVSLGKKEINNGCHIIQEKGRIDPSKKIFLPIENL